MKCTVCGERGRSRMNHSEMMLNEAENCPLNKTKKHISLGRGCLLLNNVHTHFSELSHNMKY